MRVSSTFRVCGGRSAKSFAVLGGIGFLWTLTTSFAPAASGQTRPVFYLLDSEVVRMTEAPDELMAVSVDFRGLQALAVGPRGDLLAIEPRGGVYRVEPQTGALELVTGLGFEFFNGRDMAFDDGGDAWLANVEYDGTRLYRLNAAFENAVVAVQLPFEISGLTFRFGQMVVLAEQSLFTVDIETMEAELLAGPFILESSYGGVVHMAGLDASRDGRLFVRVVEHVPIAPPEIFAYVAELDVEALTTRKVGSLLFQSEPVGPAIREEGCGPTGTVLCLGAGRFAVDVEWQQPEVGTRVARKTDAITRDSGIFSFVGPSNLEVTVKVLDACGFDGHFWVFAASATSLEHTVTVRDTFTGEVQRYTLPEGGARPITDTRAFLCP